ncbi:hypothetical protein [Streptomyces sp. NPDC058193]|uniref:hypothetical protein n=1 Tax=Streptomyces sp. NPDC058193 TaxID=3346373 RepID=UPI0036EC7B7A
MLQFLLVVERVQAEDVDFSRSLSPTTVRDLLGTFASVNDDDAMHAPLLPGEQQM